MSESKLPQFTNPKLLTLALTHRSALNELKLTESNERLEFLGDAVLEIVVSEYLFHQYQDKPEGELTHLRAQLVQTKTLSLAALELGLDKQIIMSKGERNNLGHQNPSLLADCFEAVIGALFLDQNLSEAKKFIQRHLIDKFVNLKTADITDYKSNLQEMWQKQHQQTPVYNLLSASGPDHNKVFKVQVLLSNKIMGTGTGNSKQAAQQQAAKKALEKKGNV